MPDDPQPAIHVADLRKTFNVPVREAGLAAAVKCLVKRECRRVDAVDGGRWPVTIYPGWLRYSLTFLVPIAFAVTSRPKP